MTEQRKHSNPDRDKVIADSGWGVKPDDQPANAGQTPADQRQYLYQPDENDAIKNILQQMRKGFNTPNRVLVEAGRTTIFDLNGDGFVVSGLSFGDDRLIELLKSLGAGFDPKQLQGLAPDFDGIRDYRITRAWAWGAERTG